VGYAILATGLKAALVLESLPSRLQPSIVYYYRSSGEQSSAHERLVGAAGTRGLEVNPRALPKFGEHDFVMSIGWQYLIEGASGLVVLHDSLLPRFRGFAPTVTALLCGETRLGVTAIRAVSEVDAGPILSQHAVEIAPPISIQHAFERLAECYVSCITDVLEMRDSGRSVERSQNHSAASYSIWRDDLDFFVDWRQSADNIHSHILAVGYPYQGAMSRLDAIEVRIDTAEVIRDVGFEIRQPGKIWKLNSSTSADVVCGEGMLRVEVSDPLNRDRPLLNRLRVRFS